MFQFAFDTTTEDQLGWDQMGLGNILTTLDALQQTEEVGPSQLTHAPVRTQPTQPQGGATPAAAWSDTGRQSDGRRSDTGGRRDTECCRLVTCGHGDTVSRPARTAGGQGT
jgi:hypothetical protein